MKGTSPEIGGWRFYHPVQQNEFGVRKCWHSTSALIASFTCNSSDINMTDAVLPA